MKLAKHRYDYYNHVHTVHPRFAKIETGTLKIPLMAFGLYSLSSLLILLLFGIIGFWPVTSGPGFILFVEIIAAIILFSPMKYDPPLMYWLIERYSIYKYRRLWDKELLESNLSSLPGKLI